MENLHNSDDSQSNILGVMLIVIGIVSNLARTVIDNYDVAFKVLTLLSLTLSTLVFVEKALAVVSRFLKRALSFFSRTGRK